ncbi:MAG TPA: FAD-dependent oxidoreductase [Spirochaetota bacterium]|nr:FAD-dependent oxidoreductase [Spirochaetota bacterium]
MFAQLFSPIMINNVEVKNRIAYPSMGLLYSNDGSMNDRYYDYFREKARGGAGIVTVGPVGIDKVGGMGVTLSLSGDDTIPAFKKCADIIKGEGARAWVQLFHAGGYAVSWLIDGETPMAPSSVYNNYSKETPREMTIDDIKATIENFIRGAERAKEAGFDGVEIIASAGYLITQFLSPIRNIRTDEYGGSFENRTRFPREIIEGMRKRLGPDFPVTIRMAGNDFIPGSNTDVEAQDFARVYEEAGVDLINVTGGWHEARVPQLPMRVPRSAYSYLALNIKRAVSVPVMASNRISDPVTAEQIIRDGVADMVNLGRVLLADPEWPVKANTGRVSEIRPCVACNQGCTDTIFSGQPVFCIVNPRTGYEGVRIIHKTKTPKNIMVVGAGPGGLEAAVRAAEAGHNVSLYEKEADIGGQLWIAGVPPHKEEIHEILRYYRAMIDRPNITVSLNSPVSIDMITGQHPDYVIIAEGAGPAAPPIDGIDDDHVISAWKVLRDDPPLGRRIAVIGGGAVGLETAHFLAEKGTISPETLHFLFVYSGESVERLKELVSKGVKDVTVFEMLPKTGADVGKSTRWVLTGDVARLGVTTITGAKVRSVRNSTVVYEKDGAVHEKKFDDIVIAAGSVSERTLADRIAVTGILFYVIGDGKRPAKLNDAIHEAFLAVMDIQNSIKQM